jgi:hypothetical protein
MATISQTTEFSIKELVLILSSGETYDISSVFDELNLYDNIFVPCITGNILMNDGNNIGEKLSFDGKKITKLRVIIDKTKEEIPELRYEKEFVVYNMTHKQNVNFTSQRYILHFCSEEFIYSEQIKINEHFRGIYSDIVLKILTNHLKVSNSPPKNGKAGIGIIDKTIENFFGEMPLSTPFNAINWICKRAITPEDRIPDYIFFENHKTGYNFRSIKKIMETDPKFTINFNPKNLDNDINSEFLGARNVQILSQYNSLKNIKNGSYAGRKVLFDTLTRTYQYETLLEKDIHTTAVKDGKPNLPDGENKENSSYKQMYNSRVVAFPYSYPRKYETEYGDQTKYFKEHKNSDAIFFTTDGADNVEEYIYKRRPIFANFLQRRLQLVMPGNFGLMCGQIVFLSIPKYSIKSEDEYNDKTLSGKYMIIGTRHKLSYDKHETIIQVATDKIQF